MLRFIVNDREVSTELSPALPAVDYLRDHRRMHGVRVGCREGDCGACAVLVGELIGDQMRYEVLPSCLTPLANVHGKHLVTVEGLNLDELTPVQQAFVDQRAIQCGFCSPGLVVSTAAFYLGERPLTRDNAINALAGNICRCTGYKAIERAVDVILAELDGIDTADRTAWLVDRHFLPPYFSDIPAQLAALDAGVLTGDAEPELMIAGASDVMVQRPEEVADTRSIRWLNASPELKQIRVEGDQCFVGAAVTFNRLRASAELRAMFPDLEEYIELSGSDLVRNMATVGGNIVNGSPIGDVSIFFTAIGATVLLNKNGRTREVPCKDFFVGYKTTAIEPGELMEGVRFRVPDARTRYSFEKISKRRHLDMAVVNSAMRVQLDGRQIEWASFAVGGLGSTIRYMADTVDFLTGRTIDNMTFHQASEIAQGEITPRSRPEYKRLLVRQQLFLHLRRFAPDAVTPEVLR
jgi:xanthine dehydrogenase small subunit